MKKIIILGDNDSYILIGHFIYDELLVQPTFKFIYRSVFFIVKKRQMS
jgi:hypothetical protein